jgi:hypothetical protein
MNFSNDVVGCKQYEGTTGYGFTRQPQTVVTSDVFS